MFKTIAVIGAGNLGTSVINMLYNSGHKNLIATKRSEKGLEELAKKYAGIKTTTNNPEAAKAEILILSVKPAYVKDVAEEIRGQDKLLISLGSKCLKE